MDGELDEVKRKVKTDCIFLSLNLRFDRLVKTLSDQSDTDRFISMLNLSHIFLWWRPHSCNQYISEKSVEYL